MSPSDSPTAARYLAESLAAHDVSSVFLVPTVLSATLVELERRTSIRRIVTHGEKAAAYMADGYARATGGIGVCMAQNIGAANLAAGLRDAWLGCSPVLALTGGPYSWSRGRNYYQEIEDFPLFKPVTKSSGQVFEAERLPDMLAHATRTALSGKRGPVHLELAGHTGDTVENQLLDAPTPTPPASLHDRVEPDPAAVQRVVEALRGARRPVVLAGGGVRSSDAGAQVVALAEALGAPLATSLNGKSTVPADHPLAIGIPGLYARASANEVLLEADLVLYVGSQTGSQVTLTWTVPPVGTRIAQIDIEPTEIGRHYPTTVGMVADARVGVTRLLERLAADPVEPDPSWAARAVALGHRWRDSMEESFTSETVPMLPQRLAHDLSDLLPENGILVSDTGHAGMWTGGYVDLRHPGQDYLRAAGSLGWGLPAAIGAQLGRPDDQVVLFTGDGGLWYHLAELETAARWQIPLVVVVNNNRSLNQEIGPYTAAYGGQLSGRHHELWHFEDVDFTRVAEAVGVRAERVVKPAELGPALERAYERRGPTLIDVVTDMDVLAPKGSNVPAPH